jgi:hypothetical protein
MSIFPAAARLSRGRSGRSVVCDPCPAEARAAVAADDTFPLGAPPLRTDLPPRTNASLADEWHVLLLLTGIGLFVVRWSVDSDT